MMNADEPLFIYGSKSIYAFIALNYTKRSSIIENKTRGLEKGLKISVPNTSNEITS